MIEETCLEIGALEQHWSAIKEMQGARRRRIRYIDDLIDQFEKLNLAEEQQVPQELSGRVQALILEESHPLSTRPVDQIAIAEWLDALFDVQDSLMFGTDEGE